MVPVHGTVTYDGKPVGSGNVAFHPVADGPLGYGSIQMDGSFTVHTGSREGLAPGEYKVTVYATGPMPEPTAEDPEPVPPSLIPERYGKVNTSELRFTAGLSGGNCPIELSSSPAAIGGG